MRNEQEKPTGPIGFVQAQELIEEARPLVLQASETGEQRLRRIQERGECLSSIFERLGLQPKEAAQLPLDIWTKLFSAADLQRLGQKDVADTVLASIQLPPKQ